MRIEFHVMDEPIIESTCGETAAACADWSGEIEYNGHVDYGKWYVFMQTDQYSDRHRLNHELGHVFGLWDPVDVETEEATEASCANGAPSIMHCAHYCGEFDGDYENWDWPRAGDGWTVGSIINEK